VVMPAQFPAQELTDADQESSVLDLPHEDLGEVRKIIYFVMIHSENLSYVASQTIGVSISPCFKYLFPVKYFQQIGKIHRLLSGTSQ
jgi:hypothetical protein